MISSRISIERTVSFAYAMVYVLQPGFKSPPTPVDARLPISKPLSPALIERVESSSTDFVVNLTEHKTGLYINGSRCTEHMERRTYPS